MSKFPENTEFLRQYRTEIVPKMRSRFLSRECIRRPKEVPLGYDRRNTDVFQGSFVYYLGKRSSRFGAWCPQHTKKSSRKAQTDWIVLQMPLGYCQAVFVRCCLKSFRSNLCNTASLLQDKRQPACELFLVLQKLSSKIF